MLERSKYLRKCSFIRLNGTFDSSLFLRFESNLYTKFVYSFAQRRLRNENRSISHGAFLPMSIDHDSSIQCIYEMKEAPQTESIVNWIDLFAPKIQSLVLWEIFATHPPSLTILLSVNSNEMWAWMSAKFETRCYCRLLLLTTNSPKLGTTKWMTKNEDKIIGRPKPYLIRTKTSDNCLTHANLFNLLWFDGRRKRLKWLTDPGALLLLLVIDQVASACQPHATPGSTFTACERANEFIFVLCCTVHGVSSTLAVSRVPVNFAKIKAPR